MLTVDTVTIMP